MGAGRAPSESTLTIGNKRRTLCKESLKQRFYQSHQFFHWQTETALCCLHTEVKMQTTVSLQTSRRTLNVIGHPIDVQDWNSAVSKILDWARARESRVVCICNTHSLVTAGDDPGFARILAEADMATADGAPVAWTMKRLGAVDQQRINGPDLMWKTCAALNKPASASVFLYGNTEETNALLTAKLKETFPNLTIAGAISPPFRSLDPEEEASIAATINDSGAGVVWVSLGCPKQEYWMAKHRGSIKAVMVGVGAAFDYHAGTIKRAPMWMQQNGLEWAHRLLSEPKRLWRRYLYNNSQYLIRAIGQVSKAALASQESRP